MLATYNVYLFKHICVMNNHMGENVKCKIIDGKYFQLKCSCSFVIEFLMLPFCRVATNENQSIRIKLGCAQLKNDRNNNRLMVPFVIHFLGKGKS